MFVENLSEVPDGAQLLYSAHGVSPEIRRVARQRHLKTIDATCPLVTKVHLEAVRYAKDGYTIVLIGHEGHDEVIGTMGEAPEAIVLVESPEDVDRLELTTPKLAYLTQTTLSVDDANRIIARLKAAVSAHRRARRKKTSATPRKTGKRRCACSRARPTWCWSWEPKQLEQPAAGRTGRANRACRPI